MTTTEYENEVKSNVKNNTKDSVFRFLFEKDREKQSTAYMEPDGFVFRRRSV